MHAPTVLDDTNIIDDNMNIEFFSCLNGGIVEPALRMELFWRMMLWIFTGFPSTEILSNWQWSKLHSSSRPNHKILFQLLECFSAELLPWYPITSNVPVYYLLIYCNWATNVWILCSFMHIYGLSCCNFHTVYMASTPLIIFPFTSSSSQYQ